MQIAIQFFILFNFLRETFLSVLKAASTRGRQIAASAKQISNQKVNNLPFFVVVEIANAHTYMIFFSN